MTDTSHDRYVEAPEEYQPVPGERSVFLAGGITHCPNWQAEALDLIHDRQPEAVVINPRRAVFDPGASETLQVEWEHHHLQLADVVLFWFPAAASDQPIALFELGAALHRGATVVIGAEQTWHRYTNLAAQVRLAGRDIEIHRDLAALARAAVAVLGHPGRLSRAASRNLQAARSTAFAAIAREARAHRDSPVDASTYGPRPEGNDMESIAEYMAEGYFQFAIHPIEIAEHVRNVLVADAAREQLRADGILTAGRWFPLYSDTRDALAPLAPAPQLYNPEAAKALRRAGFTLKRYHSNSTWTIVKGPA